MAAANATPTAIPSGILCNVTANTNMLVRDNLLCGPSGEGLPKWRCGVIRSISKRNAIPAMKPPYGRDDPGSIFRAAHFYGRYQQRPYGSRHHDTGSESQ